MPFGPCPVGRVGEPAADAVQHVRHLATRCHGVIAHAPRADDRVEDEGEQDAADDADDDLGREGPLVAVGEEVAELRERRSARRR